MPKWLYAPERSNASCLGQSNFNFVETAALWALMNDTQAVHRRRLSAMSLMRDLTEGPVVHHIVRLAAPLVASMLAQISYQLIDLYFLASTGVQTMAGVNAAGVAGVVVLTLTQTLGSATLALVAQAVGRRDPRDANTVFNQAIAMSFILAGAMIFPLYVLTTVYLEYAARDRAMIDAGSTFLRWVLPGYALMLPLTVFGSALRGLGLVRPTIAVQILTIVINALLAPVLISGWITGVALGAAGAGLATSIAVFAGTLLLGAYFHRSQHYLRVQSASLGPRFIEWRRISSVGFPAGCETGIMLLSAAVVYFAIRNFGPEAQAGYAIGWRVMQTVLMPAIAIALAVGPIVGQSFGARKGTRVRETFRKAVLMGSVLLVITTFLLQWQAGAIVGLFRADAGASTVAVSFLSLASWALLGQGLIYTCSSTFQGMGNTLPSLVSSAASFLVFSGLAAWLSLRPDFQMNDVWFVSLGTISFQAIFCLYFVLSEFNRRLPQHPCSGPVDGCRSTNLPEEKLEHSDRRNQTLNQQRFGAGDHSN
jgi:putative MATE family efflux protein